MSGQRMTYQPIFPSALRPAASTLLAALAAAELAPATQGPTVFVEGERLCAPYRVYCVPSHLRSVIAQASGDARLLALCLGTRHWDGHVREEYVRQIVAVDRPWIAPFVVQLLGEYVVEIVEVISAAVSGANPTRFAGFAQENLPFIRTTRRRATSYWNCYHRSRYPVPQAYPAFTALESIERMARVA